MPRAGELPTAGGGFLWAEKVGQGAPGDTNAEVMFSKNLNRLPFIMHGLYLEQMDYLRPNVLCAGWAVEAECRGSSEVLF